jgi:cleavage and polyadenylation specificity factor subunit 2
VGHSWHSLKEEVWLTGKGAGFVVTPFLAGHLLGGALWRITTPQQEQLLYAVDLNQRRERHLGGCMLDAAATRPLLLISDATAAQRAPVDTHRRDRQLLDAIMQTLRGNGVPLLSLG